MSCFRKLATEDRGTEIVEAAAVLPLVFLLMLAIFWFGRAFNISSTLARAVKEGALTASLASCATCGNAPASNQDIADAVQKVLAADNLNVSNLQSYTPPFICQMTPAPVCTTSATASSGSTLTLQICSNVPVTCGTGGAPGCGSASPPACGSNPVLGTRVSAGYLFDFTLGLSHLPAATIKTAAQTQPEN